MNPDTPAGITGQPRKPEIVELRRATDQVASLLEKREDFTEAELHEIGSCAGTLRKHLELWRKEQTL